MNGISDINTKSESILPYGLNVDIVHITCPRSHHGVYSSIADSQTIKPGQKLDADPGSGHKEKCR